jgi:hypothetical protein
LAAPFVTPKPKKNDKSGDGFIDEDLFIDKRKPSSTMVENRNLNNGEHMLIPVIAKMIHSAVSDNKFSLAFSLNIKRKYIIAAIIPLLSRSNQ